MPDIPSGMAVGVLWAMREVGAVAIKEIAARLGKLRYIRGDSSIVERVRTNDGTEIEVTFVPTHPVSEFEIVHAKYAGYLFNDSGTDLVLHSTRVTMWAMDRAVVSYPNPGMTVNGVATRVITVPAHGTCAVQVDLVVPLESVDRYLNRAVPVMSLERADGRFVEFPLVGSRFVMDGPMLAWDAKRRCVVAAGTKEWMKARIRRTLGSPIARIRRSRP